MFHTAGVPGAMPPTTRTLQVSTDGDRITGFSQTWPHNTIIWVLAEDDFTSPTGDRDHVVFLAPDSIRFETVTPEGLRFPTVRARPCPSYTASGCVRAEASDSPIPSQSHGSEEMIPAAPGV